MGMHIVCLEKDILLDCKDSGTFSKSNYIAAKIFPNIISFVLKIYPINSAVLLSHLLVK